MFGKFCQIYTWVIKMNCDIFLKFNVVQTFVKSVYMPARVKNQSINWYVVHYTDGILW